MDGSTLVREAEASGFTVEPTNGGHVKFTAPDGAIIIDASTPSDHRSRKNTRALLKQHGLGQRPARDPDDRRRAASKANSEKVSTSVALLEILQGNPGRPFSRAELQDKIGCTVRQANGSLLYLKSKHPQVSLGANGWVWTEMAPPPPPVVERVVTRDSRERRHGLSDEILQHLQRLGGQATTLPEIVKALEANSSSVSGCLFLLQKSNPDVVRVSRGKYAYRPKEPSPKDRAHARLRLVERDLRDARGVARSLLLEEKSKLEEFLAAPDPIPETPVEVTVPETPFRPIAVVPTQLPEGCPGMFEAVTVSRESLILRDENGDLWVARPIKIEVASVAFANVGT